MMIARVDEIIITSYLRAARCGVLQSEVEFKLRLSYLQLLIWDQTETNTWVEQLKGHASNPAGQFMPSSILAIAFI